MLRQNKSYVFYNDNTGYPYVSLASSASSRVIEIRPAVKVALDGGVSTGFVSGSEADRPLIATTFKVRVTCVATAVSTGVNMSVKTSSALDSNGDLDSATTVETIAIPTGAKGDVLVDTIVNKMVNNYVQFTLPGSGVGCVLVEVFPIER